MLPPGVIRTICHLIHVATRTRTVPFTWNPRAPVLKLETIGAGFDGYLTASITFLEIILCGICSVWYAHYAETQSHTGEEQIFLIIIRFAFVCVPLIAVAPYLYKSDV